MEDTDEDWIPAGEREKLQARFSSSCRSFSWLFCDFFVVDVALSGAL
jgi:hypothetical protein